MGCPLHGFEVPTLLEVLLYWYCMRGRVWLGRGRMLVDYWVLFPSSCHWCLVGSIVLIVLWGLELEYSIRYCVVRLVPLTAVWQSKRFPDLTYHSTVSYSCVI